MKFPPPALVLGLKEKTWHVIREKSGKLSNNRKVSKKAEANQRLTLKLDL